MLFARTKSVVTTFWNDVSLLPDLSRAARGTLGFMIPFGLGAAGLLPLETAFVAIAAQNLAMVDVRGAYSFRIGLLVVMIGVLALAAGLGALASTHLLGALAVTALMTLACGVWRHLSADYGPSLSIASLLVLFLALASPAGAHSAARHAASVLAGGGLGLLLQLAYWPIYPQHPLRRTVAESWLAAADLFEALAPADAARSTARHEKVTTAEHALRKAIDKAELALIQASARRNSVALQRLEALNLSAARLAVRVSALNTSLESCFSENSLGDLAPALGEVLASLTNTSRTIALAAVSRQPAHFAAGEVRLRRTGSLLDVMTTQIQNMPASACQRQLEVALQAIREQLPEIHHALRETLERADERAAFSLELFDLNTWMLRPLAASLNLSRSVEPALVRYILRLTVLTTLGVAAYKLLHIPHGYWLPFTIVVVLQPDYGATRERAVQRVLGTVAGSIAASVLLWMQLPHAAALAVIALCVFAFGYAVRRHYAVAMFFVTVFVVLMMEAGPAADPHIVFERVAATVMGGLVAIGAAAVFWPIWEKDRFAPILAQALRANAVYLERLAEYFQGSRPRDARLRDAKRGAENANSAVFGSLKRMFGDPKNRRERVEQAAAVANANQRLTRIFNLLFVQLEHGRCAAPPTLTEFARIGTAALGALAHQLRQPATAFPAELRESLMRFRAAGGPAEPESVDVNFGWMELQLGRAATELSAMVLSLEKDDAAEETDGLREAERTTV